MYADAFQRHNTGGYDLQKRHQRRHHAGQIPHRHSRGGQSGVQYNRIQADKARGRDRHTGGRVPGPEHHLLQRLLQHRIRHTAQRQNILLQGRHSVGDKQAAVTPPTDLEFG